MAIAVAGSQSGTDAAVEMVWQVLGWFGPVGVSALFYLTMEAERLGVQPEVLAAGTFIVVASTVVHGLGSSPGLAAYRRANEAEGRT
jgi:NhaP-type Na+/H+ or K+/H+ antiporter